MRRAAWVGLVTLLLAALLGLQRANDNITEEVDAAMGLAEVVARLGSLGDRDDAAVLAELRELQTRAPLRHLELRVHDEQRRLLLAPPQHVPAARPLELLYELHRRLGRDGDRRLVAWQIERPAGKVWSVSLRASHDSERREALDDLLGVLALLGLGIAALLGVMQANVSHALRPLTALLQAIRGIEATDQRAVDAVRCLPAMPMRELDVIATALRHLAQALDEASEQRRALSHKVLSLQEDERAHLARELHDEFGQRLTALRLDATWLQRQLALQAQAGTSVQALSSTSAQAPAQLAEVVDAMAARCAEVQGDIRSLLVRLRPLASAAAESTVAWSEVVDQLKSLVQAWRASAARGAAEVDMRLQVQTVSTQPPRELTRATALALYRLSQEALTNVARHAQASRADIVLGWHEDATGRWLTWQAHDDGIGITDPAQAQRRGNGLGGMQERVWALGGEWQAMGPWHNGFDGRSAAETGTETEGTATAAPVHDASPRPGCVEPATQPRPGLSLGARLPLP